MSSRRLLGSGLALTVGLLGGAVGSAMAGTWLGSDEQMLTAKQCASGQMSVGEVTYEIPSSASGTDEAPVGSGSSGERATVLDVAPPQDLQPVAETSLPEAKAKRWLRARPDLAQTMPELKPAADAAGGKRVVNVDDAKGARVAQLIFEEYNAIWRLESVLECAR